MRKSVFSVIAILLISTLCVKSQSIIHLKDVDNLQPIGKLAHFFQDAQKLSIDQILVPSIQSKFEPYHQHSPNFGPMPDPIWFKFDAVREVDQPFYLHFGSGYIDSIALYAVTDGQVKQVQVSGDNYVFDDRAVKVTTFLFPLEIPLGGKQTYFLRAKCTQPLLFALKVGTLKAIMEDTHLLDFIQGIYHGFMLLILLYNIFLYYSTKERLYLLYSAYVLSITWFMASVYQYIFEYLWPTLPIINQYAVLSSAFTIFTATMFTRTFLHTNKLTPRLHKFSYVFIVLSIIIFILVFTPLQIPALMIAQMVIMMMAFYFLFTGVTVLRKGYKPAKFYLVAWSFLILGFIAAILESINLMPVMYYINSMQIGSAIEVTLLSFALADRINVYKKEREEAQAGALQAAKEQAELIQQQNIILEERVSERTLDLKKSIDDLKATQAQLIQSEKLASLGELTAGIAHEIQNPLNFVNNFSDVSSELITEMNEEIGKGNTSEVIAIAGDLKLNLEKISHHGQRASSIVKGMLQHSRRSNGEKELTDINKLADEYLRLAYHGLRAKDKAFNATMITKYDENIGTLHIVTQDMGRVILNLITNAFYAVAERSRSTVNEKRRWEKEDKENKEKEVYEPSVTITTKKLATTVEIHVGDNGNGIPEEIKAKIFQPFFTTKPTGLGTGLGLSLAYDIVKAHGGELKVETKEGEGSEFIIQLPI